MALLGEMHYIPLGPDSWVNLQREGGVAYATQESWVQNETIKVGPSIGLVVRYERGSNLVGIRKISCLVLRTTRSDTRRVCRILQLVRLGI